MEASLLPEVQKQTMNCEDKKGSTIWLNQCLQALQV